MGWFDSSNPQATTADPSNPNFNYQTQEDLIKQKRALATSLIQKQAPQGQMVSGWYVKPSMTANIGTMLQQAIGAMMLNKSNSDQSSLDANSLAATQSQLAGLNAPVTDPNQAGVEAQAQTDREVARMQSGAAQDSGVQAGQVVGDDSPVTDRLAPSPGIPTSPSTAVPLPPVQSVSPAPAKKLPTKQVAALLAKPAAPQPGSDIDYGSGNGWNAPSSDDTGTAGGLFNQGLDSMNVAIGNALKKGAQWFTGTDAPAQPTAVPPAQAAALASQLAPAPAPTTPPAGPPVAPPVAPMPVPQAAPQPAPVQAPPALPAQMTQHDGLGQLTANGPVIPNPYSSAPQTAPGVDTLNNGQQVQTSNPNPYQQAPTQDQLVGRLLALGRSSPEGAQIAQAQLNQMFASKNGRFTTDVKNDPVNGGFVAVTTDSQTGRITNVQPINAGSSTMVTGQTTDANGNRLNVHKDGSTSPMMSNGQPVVDSSVTAKNDDQTVKIAAAQNSNANALAAIDTALNRNARIAQLYHSTATGPIGGNLPNFTSDRQELHSLLAQDLFSETRNALAGAGDAGGAPKMAQSEFKYMENNGGLSQTTNEGAAMNIIANMNAQLMRQKQALQQYGATIGGTTPGQAAPGRGQTVSASQYGF